MTRARKLTVKQLAADAKNRALRTALQSLAVDVAIAVSFVVVDATSAATVDYRLLLLALPRTVLQAGASWFMRRHLDRSSIPTPTPPTDPDAG